MISFFDTIQLPTKNPEEKCHYTNGLLAHSKIYIFILNTKSQLILNLLQNLTSVAILSLSLTQVFSNQHKL